MLGSVFTKTTLAGGYMYERRASDRFRQLVRLVSKFKEVVLHGSKVGDDFIDRMSDRLSRHPIETLVHDTWPAADCCAANEQRRRSGVAEAGHPFIAAPARITQPSEISFDDAYRGTHHGQRSNARINRPDI
jgi:hypothetical protein